jgi:hypothetical protein
LKKEPDQYARAVGAVAARDFLQADNLIPYLDGRVEASLLLTLRGDRMYFEGRPDEALPVYRQALSLQMCALLQGRRLGGGRQLGKEARFGEVRGMLGGEGAGGGVCGEELRFEGVTEGFN